MFEIGKKNNIKSISMKLKEEEYNFVVTQAEIRNLSVTDYFRYVLGKEYTELQKANTKVNTIGIEEGNNNSDNNTNNNTTNITTTIKNSINKTKSNTEKKKKAISEGNKICKICGIEKSITEYHISKTDKVTGKVYYKTYCNECAKDK